MNNPLDVNTGLPIFLLTNNHPEKFFEHATYRFEPKAVLNINKLKQVFFSPENVKYLQEKMAYEVLMTTKKYKIPYQNEQDLRMIMETIYFDKTRNIGYDLNEQLAELNTYIVKFCVPLIINEINVYLNYLDDINKPRSLNTLPVSTGNLRSVSGYASQSKMSENIFLPDNQIKYIFSTTGDVTEYEMPRKAAFAPSMISNNPANIYSKSSDGRSSPSGPRGRSSPSGPRGRSSPSGPRGPSVTQPDTTWFPSAVLFQDDPYYLRNSLLSPKALKPRVPPNVYPTDKNGLFANAGGSDFFLANNNNYKYASADIESAHAQAPKNGPEMPADGSKPSQASAGATPYKRK
jgi:hypothetical protein